MKVELLDELRTLDCWNPAHFGDAPRRCEPNGQMTIFFDIDEPPDPDDYPALDEYEAAWQEWEGRQDEIEELTEGDRLSIEQGEQIQQQALEEEANENVQAD